MKLLAISAVSLAFLHALAPDHWLPFVALARSSRWSLKKLAWVSTLAGLGHVVSSLLIGLLGLWAGWAVGAMQGVEAWRGNIAIWMLIGFGAAYALWGLKHAQHRHPHVSVEEVAKAYATKKVWMLIAILVFGPCEPLIPLMFLSYTGGVSTVVIVCLLFSLVTVAMIVGQSCLAFVGTRLVKAHWVEHYAHSLAGVVILITAVSVLMFDL